MKKLLSLFVLGFSVVAFRAAAQEQKPQDSQEKSVQEAAPKSIFKTAIELNAGTQGLGLEFKMPVMSRLSVRAGGSFFFFKTQREDTFGEEKAHMKLSADFNQVHAIADFQPFSSAKNLFRKFIVSAGTAYYYKAEGNANFQPTETYKYGEIEFTPDEIGEVDAKVNWNRVAPYVGVGFTDLKLAGPLKLNAGLGLYYFNSPDVKFTGTKMVADNSENEATLERNMKDYRYLPALQVGISYPFKF